MLRTLKFSTVAFVGCAAVGSLAQAADLYTSPPTDYSPVYSAAPAFTWTGFYAGVNGGYGWGDTDSSNTPFDFDMDGWFAGGQIGYNYQFANNLVLGVETDIQWSGIGGSTPFAGSSITQDLNWFGTLRGRVGYAMGNWMPYFTGGFAYGDGERTSPLGPGFSESKTHTGYVLGGGVEYAVTPNWTVKGEYQYIDLGAETYSNIPADPNADMKIHTVRVGVNYKF